MKFLCMTLLLSTSCGAQTLNCPTSITPGPYGLHPGYGGDVIGTKLASLSGTATERVCKRFVMTSEQREFGYFYELQSKGNTLSSDAAMIRESPAGTEPKMFHLKWNKQPDPYVAYATDPRVEIIPSDEYVPSGIRWYAVSIYVPGDWTPVTDTSLFQLHTKQRPLPPPPPGTTLPQILVPPPMAFIANGTQLKLHMRTSTRQVTGDDVPNGSNVEVQNIALGPLKTQQWYCLVVQANWQSTVGSGDLLVWLNGKLRYEAHNVHNHYVNGESYPKAGMYMPGRREHASQHLYVSPIYIGDEGATYDNMAALTKCPAG